MTSVLILGSGFDGDKFFLEDNDDPGDLIAQFRQQGDPAIFFNIPTEFLTATFANDQKVDIELTESFGAADINVGSLTIAGDNPEAIGVSHMEAGDVLLASFKTINEIAPDAGADIYANSLILSAGQGVGATGTIELQVNLLEAETTTGGIDIYNNGNLIIGGLTDDANGLDVETAGNLNVTALGSIVLSDESPGGFESVHGGNNNGNVVLKALGFDSDIVANVDQDSIAAPGGKIELNAGRDISFGTLGLNFDNDVRASEELKVVAGRDINVDGFADLASDGFGAATGGDVIAIAGRDINILNSTGTDGSIGAEGSGGADARLTTGYGGFLRALATSTSTIFSSTGDVFADADRMLISSVAGITASGGMIVIRPRTSGWQVDLGSATDGAFALEISDAELDRMFTPNLLIGGATTGKITVSSGISPAAATNLELQTSSSVRLNASVTTTGSLTVRADADITQLGASALTAGGPITLYVDEDGAADGGKGGKAILNGSGDVVINGNVDNDVLSASSGADTLNGGDGADTLRGFGGNDSLVGGAGVDQMEGGLGDDTYVFTTGDAIVEAVGEGVDLVLSAVDVALSANVENLTLTGAADVDGTGNDEDNRINGNGGDNLLTGNAGKDTMNGLAGADSLNGGNQDDRLNGGGGQDLLNGGAKNDRLEGGADNDTFRFDTALSNNRDKIDDYAPADDTLQLENTIFTSLAVGVLPGAQFVLGTAAVDGNDFIIYDSTKGAILYDADGNGAGLAFEFATVTIGTVLSRFDFVVT